MLTSSGEIRGINLVLKITVGYVKQILSQYFIHYSGYLAETDFSTLVLDLQA